MKFSLLFNIICLQISLAKDSVGECPKTSGVANFNPDAYIGRWYEFRRDQATQWEWFGECVTATYTVKADGKIDVKNRSWFWWWFFSYYTAPGIADCKSQGQAAECEVRFFENSQYKYTEPNYKVISTDYSNYAMVYSCRKNAFGGKTEDFWILTRVAVPTKSEQDTYKDLAKKLLPDYDHSYVVYTKQGEPYCKYE